MNVNTAFLQKEFLENWKNRRCLILLAVFLLFGLGSPFLARYTPEILAALSPGMQMEEGPTVLDAWEQFYKNISGVGFSALIILFGSWMSGEYAKGTLVLLVTKGLPRRTVIFAKYTVAVVLMTVSYWTGFFAACCAAAYLWPEAAGLQVCTAGFYLWLLGFLYLSILLLGCVLFGQTFTSILFTGGAAAVLSLLGVAGPLKGWSPFALCTKNVDLLSGTVTAGELLPPAVLTLALTIAGLWAADRVFGRKQL